LIDFDCSVAGNKIVTACSTAVQKLTVAVLQHYCCMFGGSGLNAGVDVQSGIDTAAAAAAAVETTADNTAAAAGNTAAAGNAAAVETGVQEHLVVVAAAADEAWSLASHPFHYHYRYTWMAAYCKPHQASQYHLL